MICFSACVETGLCCISAGLFLDSVVCSIYLFIIIIKQLIIIIIIRLYSLFHLFSIIIKQSQIVLIIVAL